MKIVLAHNYYQQAGGEDQVFHAESQLLAAHGHSVQHYVLHNDQVTAQSGLALARKTLWNAEVYREVRTLLGKQRPQVLHVHNTLPLISPAIYHAAKAEGVAVVQTLHNYRLLCPAATFFRDGQVCEACLGKTIPWPAVQHACYRGSRAASGAVAGMLVAHRLRGTYRHAVDAYIALTEFARQKFVAGGLPGRQGQLRRPRPWHWQRGGRVRALCRAVEPRKRCRGFVGGVGASW
jgi:hypothetical protein